MITAAHVRQRIETRPFRPFRIFMSDGSHHDVLNHDFAWIFGSIIFVGVPAGTAQEQEPFVKELSLLHVSRLEPLRGLNSKGGKRPRS